MEILAVEKKEVQRKTSRNDLLKLLALVTMLVDHIGYMYYPDELLFRVIGRLAFPIFAYQIALGYSRTSNLKRYVSRILIFAIVTQVPYSVFNPGFAFNPIHFNVLFTFTAAIGLLWVYDMGVTKFKNFMKDRNCNNLLLGIVLLALSAYIIVLPEVISFNVKGFNLEYGMLAMILVLFFHIFEDKPLFAIISIIVLYSLHGYYRVALFNSAYQSEIFWSNLFDYKYVWNELNLQEGISQLQRYYFNSLGVFALIPIYMLENINTSFIRLNKYVSYIFYPAHIALLVGIAFIMK